MTATEPGLGQIGLVSTGGFWGKVIQGITRSKYNHVIVYIGSGWTIGAEPGGVALHRLDYWTGGATPVWSEFDLDPDVAEDIATDAFCLLGTPYNYLDDFLIGVCLLLSQKTPFWIKRRVTRATRLQCAQLADYVLSMNGVPLFDDHRVPGAVYPASFVPLLRKQGVKL